MSNSIEFSSIDDIVKDSEVVNYIEKGRMFNYDLNEKAAKSKLLKKEQEDFLLKLLRTVVHQT